VAVSIPKQIVILGAGVAGIRAALDLSKKVDSRMGRVVLVDENDYHQYLYKIQEVCNKDYEEKDIIVPITRLIEGKGVEFIKASVRTVDPERRVVETTGGEISYDILVIALGSHVTYFGIEGLEENSMTLSSFEAAKEIRSRIEEQFKEAERTRVPPNIVVGGGGFTGVELAGEIADWYPILCREHNIEKPQYYVSIVEMMPTILTGWDEGLVLKGQEVLSEIGVQLVLNEAVTRVSEGRIELKSGKTLEPDLFIWNGGVLGDPACGSAFEIKGRRISIDDYCRAEGHDSIYVAGDSACATNGEGRPLPPTAHIAMVHGELVARNVASSLRGEPLRPYVHKRIGEIVTLGRTYAIGDLYGFKFKGVLAKFMKKVVHWWYLHSIGGFGLLLGS
jgi:NADH dehydrogenase